MDKKIVEYYSNLGLHPHKLIQKGGGLHGLPRSKVEAAMEYCYNKIVHQGKEIDRLDIARYVWNAAKDMDGKTYEQDNDLLEAARIEMHRDKRAFYILLLIFILENCVIFIHWIWRLMNV